MIVFKPHGFSHSYQLEAGVVFLCAGERKLRLDCNRTLVVFFHTRHIIVPVMCDRIPDLFTEHQFEALEFLRKHWKANMGRALVFGVGKEALRVLAEIVETGDDDPE